MDGVLAALAVPVIWAIWLTATRAGVTGGLSVTDAGLLRFAVPALVLLPVLLRSLPDYRRAGMLRCLLIIAGAGAPFFMIAATGMKQVPLAEIGALMPGTMPIFVLMLAAVLDRRVPSPAKLWGAALVVAGVSVFLVPSFIAGHHWQGQLTVMAAASCWAVYTLALRGAGLKPWPAAALVSGASGLIFAISAIIDGTRLHLMPLEVLAPQLVVQGALAGLVGLYAYGVAVARLGAVAALYGALTPVFAALLAILLLGEVPDMLSWGGLALVTAGVVLAVRPQAVRT